MITYSFLESDGDKFKPDEYINILCKPDETCKPELHQLNHVSISTLRSC
jgi:hypothetical protein